MVLLQFWLLIITFGTSIWGSEIRYEVDEIANDLRTITFGVGFWRSFGRYWECVVDISVLDFRKSASRGFEPTRDFGVLFTGFRQWWLPLRQRRGCGLRGAVRGELETDVGFLVGFWEGFWKLFKPRSWYFGVRFLVGFLENWCRFLQGFERYWNRVVDISVCDFGSVFLRFGIVFSGVLIHREGRWQIFPHVFQYLEMMYSEPNFGSVLIHREGRW